MVMRQQVWIDRHVQGVLVGRVLLYWSGILVYFGLSTLGYHWWQNPEWTLGDYGWAMLEQLGPSLPMLLVLLPLIIFDIVRLSNRFAGPIYRTRMHLAKLNDASTTPPLNFRDDDYWQSLANPINQLQQRILELEHQVQTLTLVPKDFVEGVDNDSATPSANPDSPLEQLVRSSVSQDTAIVNCLPDDLEHPDVVQADIDDAAPASESKMSAPLNLLSTGDAIVGEAVPEAFVTLGAT